MSRLPNVGGDNNTWGDILNDFLSQEHNADGTQKTLPVAKGGTGATDATTARTNLGAISRLQDATDVSIASPAQGDTLTYDATASKFKNAGGGTRFFAETYGAKGDGVTDDTAAINAAWAALANSGGELVFSAAKTYLCLGALMPPLNSRNKPIRFTSDGAAHFQGNLAGAAAYGGATLDLRYNGGGSAVAKIDTRAIGTLEVDHLVLMSGGTDDYPFFQTTNTTVHIHHCAILGNQAKVGTACVQDAFIMGGTTKVFSTAASDAGFQGYGSSIKNNFFSNIREGVLLRTWANSISVKDNAFSTTCGSGDAAHAAIRVFGNATDPVQGCTIADNLIEQASYPYGIILDCAKYNSVRDNGIWDGGAGALGAVYCTSNASRNLIMGSVQSGATSSYCVEQTTGLNSIMATGGNALIQFGPVAINFWSFDFSKSIIAPNGLAVNTPQQIGVGNTTNYLDVGPAGSNDLYLLAAGSNANINIILQAKGTGKIRANQSIELTSGGPQIIKGAGAPTLSAPSGSLYIRTDGAAGSRIYVNQDGATTWTAITGV